MGISATELS